MTRIRGRRSSLTHDRAGRGAAPALDSPSLYLNRELSWLAFNERVLDQARDRRHPILERVKFLAIVGTNLDEFFMIRVAVLQKQMRTHREHVSPDGLTTEQQLALVRARARQMLDEQAGAGPTRCGRSSPRTASGSSSRREYSEDLSAYLAGYFQREIAPVADAAGVRPRASVPAHLQPQQEPRGRGQARGPHEVRAHQAAAGAAALHASCPPAFAGGGTAFVFIEDVVCANVESLFPARRSRARTSSASSATPTW